MRSATIKWNPTIHSVPCPIPRARPSTRNFARRASAGTSGSSAAPDRCAGPEARPWLAVPAAPNRSCAHARRSRWVTPTPGAVLVPSSETESYHHDAASRAAGSICRHRAPVRSRYKDVRGSAASPRRQARSWNMHAKLRMQQELLEQHNREGSLRTEKLSNTID